MQAIIDGKKYNTNNCEIITEYYEQVEHKMFIGPNLYPYYKITIYKTKKGTYLKFTGKAKDDGWDDINSLEVINEDDLKSILERLNKIDMYEKLFGPLEEG